MLCEGGGGGGVLRDVHSLANSNNDDLTLTLNRRARVKARCTLSDRRRYHTAYYTRSSAVFGIVGRAFLSEFDRRIYSTNMFLTGCHFSFVWREAGGGVFVFPTERESRRWSGGVIPCIVVDCVGV